MRLGTRKSRRSLRRAPAQDGRLDLEETECRHRVPHQLSQPVPEDENLLHRRSAQVEVAIGQPELLVGLRTLHLERRSRSGVVNNQLTGPHLDPARLEPGIFLACQAASDSSLDSDDVFVSQRTGLGLELFSGIGLENYLGDAVTVA